MNAIFLAKIKSIYPNNNNKINYFNIVPIMS